MQGTSPRWTRAHLGLELCHQHIVNWTCVLQWSFRRKSANVSSLGVCPPYSQPSVLSADCPPPAFAEAGLLHRWGCRPNVGFMGRTSPQFAIVNSWTESLGKPKYLNVDTPPLPCPQSTFKWDPCFPKGKWITMFPETYNTGNWVPILMCKLYNQHLKEI